MAKTAFEIATEYNRDGHVPGNVFVPKPLNVEKEVRRFQRDPLATLVATLDDTYTDRLERERGSGLPFCYLRITREMQGRHRIP